MNYLGTEQQLIDERNAKVSECVKNACESVHIIQLAKNRKSYEFIKV